MRKLLLTTLSLSALALGANAAYAGNTATITQSDSFQEAYVEQVGNNNEFTSDQSDDFSFASEGNLIEGPGTAGGNDAFLQDGNGNSADLTQEGRENTVHGEQVGNNNSLITEQVSGFGSFSRNNLIAIRQLDGNGNSIDASQNGGLFVASTNQEARLLQRGSNNEITTTQTGYTAGSGTVNNLIGGLNNARGEFRQRGNNNDAFVDQNGTYNKTYGTQEGNGNLFDVDQTGELNLVAGLTGTEDLTQNGNGNDVFVAQDGSVNTVAAYQDGNNNFIDVSQTGNFNYAEVTQTGNGHSFTVGQVGDNNTAIADQY